MQNLIEKQPKHKKDDQDDGEEKKKRPVIKSATDLQRLKLEKLMKNPDKLITIPETPREKDYMQTVPSFVRNVMGSSAGAGSGEFHVYRHLRRKEYARQKCIHAKSMREQLDDEYQSKLEKNRLEAEAKTAKKRAKRLKKKQRAKKPKVQNNDNSEKQNTTDDDDDEDEDDNTNSLENAEHEQTTEDAKHKVEERKVVNDDVQTCKETSELKEVISVSPNEKESSQDEVSKTSSNIEESKNNDPAADKTEEDKEKGNEGREISETKESLDAEKEDYDRVTTEQITDEHTKDSTNLQS